MAQLGKRRFVGSTVTCANTYEVAYQAATKQSEFHIFDLYVRKHVERQSLQTQRISMSDAATLTEP